MSIYLFSYKKNSDTLRHGSNWQNASSKLLKKEQEKTTNSRRLMENFVQWRPTANKKTLTAAELQPD
jgi:hypothetical protein